MNVELSIALATKMEGLHAYLVLFVEEQVDKLLTEDSSADAYDKIIENLEFCEFFSDVEKFIRENNITLEILFGENKFGEKYTHDFKGIVFNSEDVALLQLLIDTINETIPNGLRNCCYGIVPICNGTKCRVERLLVGYGFIDRPKTHCAYLNEIEILTTYFLHLFKSAYKIIAQSYLERKMDDPLK